MTDKEYSEIEKRKQKADIILTQINKLNADIKYYKSLIKEAERYEKKYPFDCLISMEGKVGEVRVGKIKMGHTEILGILHSELLKLERQLATQQKMFEYL